MKPIDYRQLRKVGNLERLRASEKALAQENPENRPAFIRAHEHECSALRDALWQVGCAKCWYSEAVLQHGEGHVEHYRPKRRLHGSNHEGYWWRAFDWENLRLAHPTVNLRRTDYLTGRLAGKGSYFPLRDEANRAHNRAEEMNEESVLLDPVAAADTRLIYFSEESGAPRPAVRKDQDEWCYRRAEESIDYYHLNEGTWNAKRADLMATVRKLCDQVEALALEEPRDQEAYSQKVDEVVAYLSPYQEFSAACVQIIRDRGLLERLYVP
jgi:hypothetical protein